MWRGGVREQLEKSAAVAAKCSGVRWSSTVKRREEKGKPAGGVVVKTTKSYSSVTTAPAGALHVACCVSSRAQSVIKVGGVSGEADEQEAPRCHCSSLKPELLHSNSPNSQ
jgi:hypothetical protein